MGRSISDMRATLKPVEALSLMYHDVVEPGCFGASGFPGEGAHRYKLERAAFRRHLEAIRDSDGAGRVSMISNTAPWSGRPVFLTFDDGGISAHGCIAPMLESFGWRGHFFITTGRIGSSGFVSEAQIRDLRQRGHVIGSHSITHPTRMSYVPWEQMKDEWSASKARLEEILGEPVKTASVPGGFYSKKVAQAAALAGFEALFNSEPESRTHSVDGCLVIGRYAILRDMPPAISGAIAAGSFFPRWKQSLLWKAKKVAKAAGGGAYLRVRETLVSK